VNQPSWGENDVGYRVKFEQSADQRIGNFLLSQVTGAALGSIVATAKR